MPVGMPTYGEALRAGAEVFGALRSILHDDGFATGQGDEGGFAPSLASNEAAVEVILRAIEKAGYRPGEDVAIALDPATTELVEPGSGVDGAPTRYVLAKEGRTLESGELIDLWADWVARYPIVSIEDGLAEDDWDGWKALDQRLGEHDPARRRRPARHEHRAGSPGRSTEDAVNAVLIKLNQIGTLTETLEAIEMAQRRRLDAPSSRTAPARPRTPRSPTSSSRWAPARSRPGAPSRSERVAKYNRLLRIEGELGDAARYPGPIGARRRRESHRRPRRDHRPPTSGSGWRSRSSGSFLLIIPIESMIWLLALPSGLLIGYYANRARTGATAVAAADLERPVRRASRRASRWPCCILLFKALFFFADGGYRDFNRVDQGGKRSRCPARPAPTACTRGTWRRAGDRISRRRAWSTRPRSRGFYWSEQFAHRGDGVRARPSSGGVGGAVLYGVAGPKAAAPAQTPHAGDAGSVLSRPGDPRSDGARGRSGRPRAVPNRNAPTVGRGVVVSGSSEPDYLVVGLLRLGGGLRRRPSARPWPSSPSSGGGRLGGAASSRRSSPGAFGRGGLGRGRGGLGGGERGGFLGGGGLGAGRLAQRGASLAGGGLGALGLVGLAGGDAGLGGLRGGGLAGRLDDAAADLDVVAAEGGVDLAGQARLAARGGVRVDGAGLGRAIERAQRLERAASASSLDRPARTRPGGPSRRMSSRRCGAAGGPRGGSRPDGRA